MSDITLMAMLQAAVDDEVASAVGLYERNYPDGKIAAYEHASDIVRAKAAELRAEAEALYPAPAAHRHELPGDMSRQVLVDFWRATTLRRIADELDGGS